MQFLTTHFLAPQDRICVESQPLWELPGCNLKPAPIQGGLGETKEKKADGSRLVGGDFNEQGNLLNEACPGQLQDQISASTHQVLKVDRAALSCSVTCTEALTRLSHTLFSLTTFPSQGCVLGAASQIRESKCSAHSKAWRGGGGEGARGKDTALRSRILDVQE